MKTCQIISFLEQCSRLFLKTSLLLLVFLNACNPAALPATTAPMEKPTLEVEDTPTEAAAPSTPEETAIPAETTTYPYYLPLAIKPDIAPQTIDGVTAAIDWVYIDESRLALHYTVSGLDWPDGAATDPMQQIRISSDSLPTTSFSGGGSWSGGYVENGTLTGSSDMLLANDGLDAEQHPSIHLSLELPVEGPTKVGTFRFDFDAPVGNGRKLENIDQSVVANDVAMTLKTLIVTPSRADALICFQIPSAVDWGLGASTITVGDGEYPFSGGGLIPGTDDKNIKLTDPERCNTVSFDIVYDESLDSITITVPRLMGSVPEVVDQERVDRANQRLAGAGIEFQYINVDHGGQIEILKQPEGKSDGEIYPLIWEALADQCEGPWAFTLPLQ